MFTARSVQPSVIAALYPSLAFPVTVKSLETNVALPASSSAAIYELTADKNTSLSLEQSNETLIKLV